MLLSTSVKLMADEKWRGRCTQTLRVTRQRPKDASLASEVALEV